VNRLLGVAAAVFAVDGIELRRALGAAARAGAGARAWLFGRGDPRRCLRARAPARTGAPALRAGRALWAVLALEATVLGAALASHLAR
jgi:hypothetical protein